MNLPPQPDATKQEQSNGSDTVSLWYLIAGAVIATGVVVGLTYAFPRGDDPEFTLMMTAIGLACASGIIVTLTKNRGAWTFRWSNVYAQIRFCAFAGGGIIVFALVGMVLRLFPSDGGPLIAMIGFYTVFGGLAVVSAAAIVYRIGRKLLAPKA